MARNPKQDANLKPFQKGELSSEEAKRRGSNGGKKSGEVRRKNRKARDAARFVLNLAAKEQLKKNLEELGYTKEDSKTNNDALHARLFTMAMSGNIDAYKLLMQYAGYDPKENRDERESKNADRRREAELDAKLAALGQAPESATMSVGIGNEDGANDVVVYIPKMMTEEECQVEEETESPASEDKPVETEPET